MKMTVKQTLEQFLLAWNSNAYLNMCTSEDMKNAIESMEEVEQYRALGTVEELKEAREKQKSRREWYQQGYQDGLNADKWIPCEERLPSDTEIHEVTAKFINGRLYTDFAYYDESREEWWKLDDDGTVNVIAWKEHSEPYKKEGAENE